MKRFICLVALVVCVVVANAQTPASKERSEKMISEISSATASYKTISCDFVQNKSVSLLNEVMKSEGHMTYKQSDKLRWEYTKPYEYVFVLNGAKVTMKNSRNTTVVDVKSSRMFQEIARIMMNSVTGNCLKDKTDFDVVMYDEGKLWHAKLTPLKKELKQMFSTVNLYFDSERKTVVAIELVESMGDKTRIDISNIKLNVPVDEATFVIN